MRDKLTIATVIN